MNRRRQKISGSKRGSALLAALCFCAVLGIALASYMAVCSQTLQLSNRNSQGTRSLELAETGMEEALWALNKEGYNWSDWTVDNGANPKVATKTIDGFSFGNGVTGSATLTIENYDGSSGLSGYAQGLRKLKVVGQTLLADGSTVTRTIQASAQKAPMFVNAVASISSGSALDGNNNGRTGVSFTSAGTVDSFDSARAGPYGDLDGDGIANIDDPDMDGDGTANAVDDDEDGDGLPNEWDTIPYGDTAGFSGVVASATSVTLTNARISGYVTAAPNQNGDARLSYSSNARVAGPTTSMSTSIDATRISTSPYQPVFEIKAPTASTPLPAGTTSIGDPTASGPALYFATDVLLTGSEVLTVNGPVILVISGYLKIQQNAKIQVTTTLDEFGAVIGTGSIQILLTGSTSELSIGGKGIENKTKRPKNVAVFDAATSAYNPPEIATSEEFHGVVYAPNSELTVSSDLQLYGSLVAKHVTISGSPSIHYDVDLRRVTTQFSGLETPYVISSWQETTP